MSSDKDIEVPKSPAAAKASRSKTIEVPEAMRPKPAAAKPKAARPAKPKPAPGPLTDEALLAESSPDEVKRLDREYRAFRQGRADELAHAQAVAVEAARHQVPLDAAALKARNRRNIAIALALLAFVALVFITTIVRLSGGAVPH